MKKLMNKKAFTIMEMLIVVAIIAVLVAIAIPTFSSSLTKAKEAKDVANVRAAYAEMQIAYLTENTPYPKDKSAFQDTYTETKTLTDGVDLEYTAPTSSAEGTLSIKTKKLTGGNADASAGTGYTGMWTWTLDKTAN